MDRIPISTIHCRYAKLSIIDVRSIYLLVIAGSSAAKEDGCNLSNKAKSAATEGIKAIWGNKSTPSPKTGESQSPPSVKTRMKQWPLPPKTGWGIWTYRIVLNWTVSHCYEHNSHHWYPPCPYGLWTKASQVEGRRQCTLEGKYKSGLQSNCPRKTHISGLGLSRGSYANTLSWKALIPHISPF